jgi:hypothetical protein
VGPSLRHADIVVVILPLSPLADDERPKRGRAGHGRRHDAPCCHPAHPCRPRTPRATHRYKKPPPRPQGSPNPNRLRGFNPLPTYPQAGGEGEGERRRRTEAPGVAPPAAKPEPPARRSQTRGSQARLRPLLPRLPLHRVAYLLPLPAPPPSSSPRRTPLHRRLHFGQWPPR